MSISKTCPKDAWNQEVAQPKIPSSWLELPTGITSYLNNCSQFPESTPHLYVHATRNHLESLIKWIKVRLKEHARYKYCKNKHAIQNNTHTKGI